jgi:hypothetical protein
MKPPITIQAILLARQQVNKVVRRVNARMSFISDGPYITSPWTISVVRSKNRINVLVGQLGYSHERRLQKRSARDSVAAMRLRCQPRGKTSIEIRIRRKVGTNAPRP